MDTAPQWDHAWRAGRGRNAFAENEILPVSRGRTQAYHSRNNLRGDLIDGEANAGPDHHRRRDHGPLYRLRRLLLYQQHHPAREAHIGNPETASFGYTRSIRNDYLDPFYARLAYEARRLWLELERKATEPLIIQCGCLNIAKESVTPDLDVTYAAQSYRTLTSLHLHTEAFTRDTL